MSTFLSVLNSLSISRNLTSQYLCYNAFSFLRKQSNMFITIIIWFQLILVYTLYYVIQFIIKCFTIILTSVHPFNSSRSMFYVIFWSCKMVLMSVILYSIVLISHSESRRPVCLPPQDLGLKGGDSLVVTGWGHLAEKGSLLFPL